MSWLVRNGHIDIEVPNIFEIQRTLVYLGEYGDCFLDSNTPINLTNISVFISYFLDVECDIAVFKDLYQLKKNINIIERHIQLFKSPIILESENSLGMIFSFNPKNEKICFVDHSYSGNNSLLQIKRGYHCRILNLEDIINQSEVCSVMFLKPPYSI